jgi:thioester reductase-like protein
VAAKIPLRCQWGSSETGLPHQLWPSELGPKDWRYIRFHPNSGAVFEEFSDGTYELVFRKSDSLAATQPVFGVVGLDQLEEYRTGDLFERHPTVPDAWCWRARADDIIVFLNGEKTNPVSMEQHIVAKNPELRGAIVVGTHRFQAALLIEPADAAAAISTADQAALIERVWPSIDETNRIAPAHARVEKSMVLVTAPDRPMMRAGKGTIQRRASVAQYSVELDKLYSDADAFAEDDTADGMSSLTDIDTITQAIRDTVLKTTGWESIGDSTTFFDNGMDSLQALTITRTLRRSLGRSNFALSIMYQNPSIAQLTTAVIAPTEDQDDDDIMKPLLSTYQGLIRQIGSPNPQTDSPSQNSGTIDVMLTGSTGTLGTFILRALLDRSGIGHVFCLNRGEDGGSIAQRDRFKTNSLSEEGLDDRVTFFRSNLAHPLLGLEEATYETVRSRVSLIIHSAWPVNFNLSLLAFRPHLAGLVNLFAFSNASTPQKMKFLFISSVSAVAGRPSDLGPVPEALTEILNTPYSTSYGRSKLLAEHLCDTGAQHVGVPVAVTRVGQVAGSVRNKGNWNPSEWFPSLVMSSRHLGCLPDSLGPHLTLIDWVPVDPLADIIVDLATCLGTDKASNFEGAEVFNLRNPSTVNWEALLLTVKEGIEAHTGKAVEVVPLETWVARLERSIEEGPAESDRSAFEATVAANPAVKLLDFYRNVLWNGYESKKKQPMVVERAVAASSTLHGLPPVRVDWMRKWVNEWLAPTLS